MTIDITDGDLITYLAVASVTSGSEVVTSAITYSGGQPATKVAMPVWWHNEVPNASLDVGRMQIAFFPDIDFSGSVDEYADQLSSILTQSFFAKTKPFGRSYTQYRHFFDIWAFPYDGASSDFATCDHSFIDSAVLMDGLVDGSVILHKSGFTDCSSIGAGGAGTVDTSLTEKAWLFVHESGHFLFGLADEYGQGGQVAASTPPNIFSNPSDCQLAKPPYGVTALCKNFGWLTETHRIETAEPETMKAPVFTSDFRNTSSDAFNNRLAKCAGGSCY